MSRSVTFKQSAFVVAVLAAVQFIIQMSLLLRGVKYAATSLVIDDTYYYLQTAWNTKQLGLVSFDGLHSTNGVQLLWFGIVYLLAILVNTKTTLLFSTLAAGFLLNLFCYVPILKIGAVVKRPVFSLFLASLWALQSLPFRIYSMGMENSVHALVYWCAVWQSLEFIVRVQKRDRPNFWGLTIVLVLNAWSRLDAALLSVILYLFCMATLVHSYRHNFSLFLQKYSKTIIGTGLLASFGIVAQLTTFRLMGDSFLPVSAIIKTSGEARGLSVESLNKFVEVLILGMPSIIQGRFPTPALIVLGAIGVLIVFRMRATLPDQQAELRSLINIWSYILVGEFLYHLYIAVSGAAYMQYFAWYRSPSFIFWIITASLVAFIPFEYIQPGAIPERIHKWSPVVFSMLIFSIAVYLFARSIDFTSKLYTARYETALWIAENSQTDTIFASWNTGQLGFFSNRTFINLDGVINNVNYYERVLQGSTSIAEYLAENKVDYLVDYATYGSVPDFPILRSFPVEDGSGRSVHIWQVSPQASLAR